MRRSFSLLNQRFYYFNVFLISKENFLDKMHYYLNNISFMNVYYRVEVRIKSSSQDRNLCETKQNNNTNNL